MINSLLLKIRPLLAPWCEDGLPRLVIGEISEWMLGGFHAFFPETLTPGHRLEELKWREDVNLTFHT